MEETYSWSFPDIFIWIWWSNDQFPPSHNLGLEPRLWSGSFKRKTKVRYFNFLNTTIMDNTAKKDRSTGFPGPFGQSNTTCLGLCQGDVHGSDKRVISTYKKMSSLQRHSARSRLNQLVPIYLRVLTHSKPGLLFLSSIFWPLIAAKMYSWVVSGISVSFNVQPFDEHWSQGDRDHGIHSHLFLGSYKRGQGTS